MKRNRRLAFLAFWIGACVVTRTATVHARPAGEADAAPALAAARDHYGRGVSLRESGDYKNALKELDEAYALAPTYRLFYELALANEGDGDRGAAIRYLQRYLADGGDSIDAARRADAETRLAKLRAKVALVTIHTNAGGDAAVTVDEQSYGAVSSEPLVLVPGARKIWVTRTGYYPSSRVVHLKEGDAVDVSVDLKALPSPTVEPPSPWWRERALLPALVVAAVFAFGALALAIRRRRAGARTVLQLNPYQADGGDESTQPSSAHTNVIELEEARHDADVGPIQLAASVETDVGRVKPTNEDSHLVEIGRSLFVVADGIGGFAGGALASATAIEAIREHRAGATEVGRFTNLPRDAAKLASALFTANRAIRQKQAATPNFADMGCTCVAARFDCQSRALYIAHVGDSRIYRLRAERLTQLTTDHTMAELGVTGRRAGHLSRALGSEALPRLDVLLGYAEPGDVYLLCCDGLNKMLSDETIASILASGRSPEVDVKRLVDAANDAGGLDNITAIVVRVSPRE